MGTRSSSWRWISKYHGSSPYNLNPLEFLTLSCPCWASTDSPVTYSSSFLAWALVSGAVSAKESLLQWPDSMYSPVCHSSLSGRGLPCVLLSLMEPKRVVNFSICLAFLLVVRIEWKLPSSLHVEPETRTNSLFWLILLLEINWFYL